MRILMVPHAYLPKVGGVERVVQQLARFLQQDGHEVCVLTNHQTGSPELETLDSVEVYRLPFVGGGGRNILQFVATWPRACWRIRNIVRRFRPDVVHQHSTNTNSIYAGYAARVAGCPIVITTHGSHRRELNDRGLMSERRHCETALAITHVSQAAKDQFAQKHPGLAGRSCVIYNGVSPQDFGAVAPEPGHLPRLVFAGRIDAYKGVDTLLQACHLLRNRSFRLVIAGEGPEKRRYQDQARELNLDHVEWRGLQSWPQVIAALKGAAAFVLPSLEEGFPMATLEAMAVGCPVVATTVGGIPEQIRHEVDGLLVPPKDPEALAGALDRLLSDPKLGRSLSTSASQCVANEFHWDRIVPQYLATYAAERV